LIEYIGGDYPEAVRNGQVVNADEYKEMLAFVDAAKEQLLATSLPESEQLVPLLDRLQAAIVQKAELQHIRSLTHSIKSILIEASDIAVGPAAAPQFDDAAKVYQKECASCHGITGHGDGPAAIGLEPAPRNFHDLDAMAFSSPFKFFNILQVGIDGTAMPSYADRFTEEELWNLAFYLKTLRFNSPQDPQVASQWLQMSEDTRRKLMDQGLSINHLARFSDVELLSFISLVLPEESSEKLQQILAVLRVDAPYVTSLPLLESTSQEDPQLQEEPLQTALKHLEDATEAMAERNYPRAKSSILDSYLKGFESQELKISLIEASLVKTIEGQYIELGTLANADEAAVFAQKSLILQENLLRAMHLLDSEHEKLGGSGSSWWGGFVASAVIILREGFEAFLIIASLLSLMTNMGLEQKKKMIHLGWMAAIAAGAGSYFLFSYLIVLSGAGRELVEAVCNGVAALVLVYVSFWLLNRAERGKWDRFVKKRAGVAIRTGSLGAMFFLAFISVYRESVETVLFYKALMSSSFDRTGIFLGLVGGTGLLVLLCQIILRLGVRIPIRKFFLLTSSFMILLAIILAGESMHEFIEAGILEATHLDWVPTISFLGIFPQLEVVGMQILFATVAGSLALYSMMLRGPGKEASNPRKG
jgi:high-affinity iron transporter